MKKTPSKRQTFYGEYSDLRLSSKSPLGKLVRDKFGALNRNNDISKSHIHMVRVLSSLHQDENIGLSQQLHEPKTMKEALTLSDASLWR